MALLCALALTVGCGLMPGDGTAEEKAAAAEESPEPATEPVKLPVGSTTTSTVHGSDLEIQVQALERVGDGRLLLTLGVGNHSGEDFRGFGRLSGDDDGQALIADMYTASGVTLLDNARGEQYLNLTEAADNTCVCSHLEGDKVGAGSMEQMWVVFPAPEANPETLTVLTPITEPFFDVPVTNGERLEAPETGEPRVLALSHPEESLAESPEGSVTGPESSDSSADVSDGAWPPLTGKKDAADSEEDRTVLGASPGNDSETQDMVAEVNEVWRDSSGRYTAVAWTVRNESTRRWSSPMRSLRAHGHGYTIPTLAGLALTDTDSSTRYLPLMNEASWCLCPRELFDSVDTKIDPGASRTFWSLYELPPEMRSVTVDPTGFESITNISVHG